MEGNVTSDLLNVGTPQRILIKAAEEYFQYSFCAQLSFMMETNRTAKQGGVMEKRGKGFKKEVNGQSKAGERSK